MNQIIEYLRARSRFDERGALDQGLLITVLVVLAIFALLFWLVTSFDIRKK